MSSRYINLTTIESLHPGCGILLAGDFNRLNIHRLSNQFRMKQLVNLPTRADQTLDLILTNFHQFYAKNSLSIFPPFGLSDHNVVVLNPSERPTSPNGKKVVIRRDTRSSRKKELGRYLSAIDWDIIQHENNCEGKEKLFRTIIKTGMDLLMPLKEDKLHCNNPPWLTVEFKNLIKRRQRAFANNNTTLYRYYRNQVNRERKSLRSKYFSRKVNHLKHTKPSSWWNAVKRISGMQPASNSENLLSQIHVNHVDTGNPLSVANKINTAFLEPMQEYQPLTNNLASVDYNDPDNEIFELTEYTTCNILQKLNPRKAGGPDEIPNWLLKEYAEILSQPICSILNSSYKEQKLPPAWKFANVVPIPKTKPVTDINKNLRPISLTPTISKVAEEFIVIKYIAPAVLKEIDPNQYGAIPKSSTIQALISMIHQWSQATDSTGAAVRITLFDYRKAFDLIDHQILVKKIQSLSIPRNICCWVVDFLTNRYQRVKLSNTYSQWEHVRSGVPQGTKLGPWLFLLMINDLQVDDMCNWKYVDDTTLSEVVLKGSHSRTQHAASFVENWSLLNKLQLNPDKCKELRIDFKQQKDQFDPIIINNQQLKVVDHVKILGLTISNTLQWTHHISEVVKKANKRLYCLTQLKRAGVPISDIVNFYCTCIRPTLEYGAEVFHHSLPKFLENDLERVQKRSLAIIFPGEEYNQILQLSGLTSLYDRRHNLCKKLFRLMTLDNSHKLNNLLPPKNDQKYNLRHKRAYTLPIIHTKRFQNTFIPSMSNFQVASN